MDLKLSLIIAIITITGLYAWRWTLSYERLINLGLEPNLQTMCSSLLQIKHIDFIFIRDTLWAFSFAVISAWLLLIKADLYLLFLCNALLVLALIDYQTGLLPDAITIPLLVFAWGFSPLGVTGASSASAILIMLLYLACSLYYLVRKRHGFGGGDIKLLAVIAAWYGLAETLNILLFASFLGLFFMVFNRANLGQAFVFGPFIVIATIGQMLI